jgi:hypothetical protein
LYLNNAGRLGARESVGKEREKESESETEGGRDSEKAGAGGPAK